MDRFKKARFRAIIVIFFCYFYFLLLLGVELESSTYCLTIFSFPKLCVSVVWITASLFHAINVQATFYKLFYMGLAVNFRISHYSSLTIYFCLCVPFPADFTA